jgi:hypothetical protein
MTEAAMDVRIGRIRTNAGLVAHLSINGEACGCGHKVTADISRVGTKTRLCRRGFTAARIAAAQLANSYTARRFSAAVAAILADVVDSRRTPAERAASTAKADRTEFARDLAAAAADTFDAQLARRHRTWAEIRADHHPTPELPGHHVLFPAA